VSNPGTEFVDVPFRLNVVSNKPVFTTALIDLGTKRVSEPVNLAVKTLMNLGTNDDLYPASFSAAKLPAGLKLDPVTGVITGRPLAVSPVAGFAFTLTATNPKGSTSVPAKLVTTALPNGLAGAYTCGVAREATICPLGGRLDFTVMPNGTLTGNCLLGASTHKFSGALDSSSSTPAVATASLFVPRTGKSDADLHLQLRCHHRLPHHRYSGRRSRDHAGARLAQCVEPGACQHALRGLLHAGLRPRRRT